MNYLFLMTLLIFSSSCTNYTPLGDNGSGEESETYYFEFDFHQAFLINEAQQIRDEMVALQEEIENGGEGHQRLEELQVSLQQNIADFQFNAELDERFGRGPIGGIRPGKPCGGEGPDEVFRCPMPRGSIENLFLNNEQWQKGSIEFLTVNGEVCGELIGLKQVSGGDEQFSLAIFEFDLEAATEMRFTKLSERGELIMYTISII